MEFVEENQKHWLLRVEKTIYGPFETQKVVDLITRGRISEVDEVALPRGRWHYVRDIQEFMRAVELQRKITSRKKAHEGITNTGTFKEESTGVSITKAQVTTPDPDSITDVFPAGEMPDICHEDLIVVEKSGGVPSSSYNQIPETGDPETGDSEAGGSEVGDLEVIGPKAGGPKAGGPKAGGPKTGGPKAGGPKAGGPKAGGSKTGGPKAGGSKTGDFEIIGPKASESEKSFRNAMIGLVGALSLFISVLFVFEGKLLQFIDAINEARKSLKPEGPLDSWSYGDYQKSYEFFKKEETIQAQHPLKYVALILKNTKNPKLAKPWLDKVSSVEKQTNAWANLNAIAYLYENNLSEAESFLKSIDQSKGELSLESLYNLATWYHVQEDWLQSKALFESIFVQKKQSDLDEATFYMIDAWIQSLEETNPQSNSNPRLNLNSQLSPQSNSNPRSNLQEDYLKVSSLINNVINSESMYRYDVAFLAFWLIQNERVSPSFFPDLEEKFMSFDPEMVFDRLSSPYVYDFFGERIKNYCDSLVGLSKFIQLSCQMTAHRSDLNSLNLPERPSGDSDQLALFSFIFDKRGDLFKSNEFLIEAFEKQDGKSSPLRFYVQARFCQVNGNYTCAVENWTRALYLNEFSPTTLLGLSKAYLETNELKKAQDFYERSMPFSQGLVSYRRLSHRMQEIKKTK